MTTNQFKANVQLFIVVVALLLIGLFCSWGRQDKNSAQSASVFIKLEAQKEASNQAVFEASAWAEAQK